MRINKNVEKEAFFADLKFGDAFECCGRNYIKVKDVRDVAAALCLDTWRVCYPFRYDAVFPYDNDAPSIELRGARDMDAAEYFKIKKRVCKSVNYRCDECFIANCVEECCDFELNHPEEAVSIMEQRAEEHSVRTRQSEFLKMFPNASLDSNGSVDICPKATDLATFSCDDGAHGGCLRCRQRYWQQEVKDEPLD